jgi:hypothetical protein
MIMAMTAVAETSHATAIRPFHVSFAETELADLRRRINATKWPERENVADQSQGVQLATMQKLARYWATSYDWRKCEAKLNALPQFVTEIDGVDIHFIHLQQARQGRPLRGVGAAGIVLRRDARRTPAKELSARGE